MKMEYSMIIKRLSLLLLTVLPLLLSSCTPTSEAGEQNGPKHTMIATVEDISVHIQVDVVQAEYAYGIYWILTDNETVYEDSEGNTLKKEDITIGDTVEITYNGQVMLSYPPQVVAHKIVKK